MTLRRCRCTHLSPQHAARPRTTPNPLQGSDHEDIEVSASVSSGGTAEEQAAAKRTAEGALWPAVLRRLEQYVAELSEAQ